MELFDEVKFKSSLGRVCLVHINFDNRNKEAKNYSQQELEALARSGKASIEDIQTIFLREINPKYFIGLGKLESIKEHLMTNFALAIDSKTESHELNLDLIIFNATLTASQQRNLSNFFEIEVLDRVDLILEIFSQRASSHEGKLQIQLAKLNNMKTKLIGGWSHLERQRGGIGLRSGAGETQLEADKRALDGKILNIKTRLKKILNQRSLSRSKRKNSQIPIIALVGYTNVGKSSIFNLLYNLYKQPNTRINPNILNQEVYAEDRLFATLDATLRKIYLPDLGEILITDTVGFINDLPTNIIEAFKSTLEEILEVDLILHIVDANDKFLTEKLNTVNQILQSIGADEIVQALVYNKIDLMAADDRENMAASFKIDEFYDFQDNIVKEKIIFSVSEKIGVTQLVSFLSDFFQASSKLFKIKIPVVNSKLKALIYQNSQVISCNYQETTNQETLTFRASERFIKTLKTSYPVKISSVKN